MKPHTKIYFKYFGYGIDDFIPCEICGRKAVDIHHIKYRSQGGTNEITNVMALCRDHHLKAHDGRIHAQVLAARHEIFMNENKTD